MNVRTIRTDNPFIAAKVNDDPYSIEREIQYKGSKKIAYEFEETRVALRQLPYDKRFGKLDKDNSKWFEDDNRDGINEIELAERCLGIDLSPYEVFTETFIYDDKTTDVISTFPNGNVLKETQGKNHFFYRITDKLNRVVAEKLFGTDSNEGYKYVHKYFKNGKDTLKVTYVYTYDITQNLATDTINFGYTSKAGKFVKGCKFKKEFYELNGEEVKVKKIDNNTYTIKDKNGKTITFKAE